MIMDTRKYEYQSEFARRYVAQGHSEGRAAIIVRLLTLRFGGLSVEVQERIQHASITELDAMGERLLTAQSLSEVLALTG